MPCLQPARVCPVFVCSNLDDLDLEPSLVSLLPRLESHLGALGLVGLRISVAVSSELTPRQASHPNLRSSVNNQKTTNTPHTHTA